MKSPIALIIASALLLTPTSATSTHMVCVGLANETLQERIAYELKSATAVFSGKVIAEEYRPVKDPTADEPEGSEVLVMKIAVERWWKGEGGEEAVMHTSLTKLPNGSMRMMAEDFQFEMGKNYLVYAYGQVDRLGTDVCRLTQNIEQATDQLRILGEGESPKKKSQ